LFNLLDAIDGGVDFMHAFEPLNAVSRRGDISSSLFYLRLTDGMKKAMEGKIPPPRFRGGDQDYLYGILKDHPGRALFPRSYHRNYKCMYPPKGRGDGWKKMGQKAYGEVENVAPVVLAFSGRPKPHEVVKKKLPGWELIAPFYEGLI
jgi:hypothetical protein